GWCYYGDILAVIGLFQFLESLFDRFFLVSGQFIPKLLQLLFGLEDHPVGLVELIGGFLGLFVGLGIGLGLGLHLLDLFLGQSRGSLDPDVLGLVGGLVRCGNLDDSVGIDVKGHFN